jgi:hypothetical protein
LPKQIIEQNDIGNNSPSDESKKTSQFARDYGHREVYSMTVIWDFAPIGGVREAHFMKISNTA